MNTAGAEKGISLCPWMLNQVQHDGEEDHLTAQKKA